MRQGETSAEIDAAAIDWATRVDGGALDEKAQADLDEWLAGDSRRLGAFARARAMFAHASRVNAFGPDFDPDAFLEQHGAGRGFTQEVADEVSTAPQPAPLRRRAFLLGGGAAVAAAAVGAIGISWQAAARTYSTKRGEIRRIPLADGSTMILNTASVARVKFTDRERHVELVEGESLFDVARDRDRPFIVAAGDTNVRALGTSFAVRRLTQEPVKVIVRRGMVEVDRSGAPAASARRLSANMLAVSPISTTRITTSTLDPSAVQLALAWRDGMLSFEDITLREAAGQFARYSDIRFSFSDPAIGEETVTGHFAADDPVRFARSTALSLGLRTEVEPGMIVFRR